FRFVGIEPLELADHLTVARRWGKDVKAFSSRRRFRPADGALRTTSGEGQAADVSKLSDYRYTGGRSRRVLDSPGAPERRHRKPRRRRGTRPWRPRGTRCWLWDKRASRRRQRCYLT